MERTVTNTAAVAAILLLVASTALAADPAGIALPAVPPPKPQPARELRKDIRDIRVERRETVKDEFQKARTDIKAIRATATSSGATKDAVRSPVKDIRTEAKQNIKDARTEAREEIKTKQAELRRVRLNREFERVYRRFTAAVERLEKLATRIESRLKKFEEQSRDMSASRTRLAEAQAKISAARNDTEAIKTAAVSSGGTLDAGTALESRRNAVKTAKESIKVAHAALVQVVNGMKPGRSGTPATTTAESSGN